MIGHPPEPPEPNPILEAQLETVRRFQTFLAERIVARKNGRLPKLSAIAVRILVVTAVLGLETASLAELARELKCSRAWLSKIALRFADDLGLRAAWERAGSREIYAARARGVHAGDWEITDRGERDRMVRRKRVDSAGNSGGTDAT